MADKGVERIVFPEACRERWLPLSTPALAELRTKGLACSGISDLVGGYSIYRECPDTHLVLYTLAGQGSCYDSGTTHVLSPGSVFVSAVGHPQYYKTDGDSWRILFFHLRDVTPWTFSGDAGMMVKTASFLDECLVAEEGLLREAPGAGDAPAPLCRALVDLLVAALQRELSEFIDPRTHAWQTRFRELWGEVDHDLARDWSLADLAERMSVSAPHLRRLCRDACGCPPMGMVTRLRMNRALELLRETDLPIKEVCSRVGYTNPQAFTTAFRRLHGVTPRAYRGDG